MTKAITLKADTTNGVQVIDIFDEENCENIHMMTPGNFYKSLQNLSGKETIYTQVDSSQQRWVDKLQKDYGVPLLPVYVIGVNIGSGEIFCSMELKVPNEIQHIVKIFQDTMKNTEDKKLH